MREEVLLSKELAAPKFGWMEVIISVVAMLPCLIVAELLTRGIGYLILGQPPTTVQLLIPAQLLAYGLWIVAVWQLFRLRGMSIWTEMCLQLPKSGLLSFLVLGPVLSISVNVIAKALDTQEIEMPLIRQLLADPVARILMAVFGVTIAPLVEEILFRGIMLPVAIRSMGLPAALLLTAGFFSVIHGPQYSWSWQHVTLLTLAGIVFGLVRIWSGSTLASTLTHAAYNLTMFTVYFVAKGSSL